VELKDIPNDYKFVVVSFMKTDTSGEIPTFAPALPYNKTQQERDQIFIEQVKGLHDQKRFIILSLGGANAQINLRYNQKQNFYQEIINEVDKYDFDGIDIDLEGDSIGAGDNVKVVGEALKEVKAYYQGQNKDFYITMAPEFPYLRKTHPKGYKGYLDILKDDYDFIHPQFYNQGGDGVSVTQEDKDNFKEAYNIDLPNYLPQSNNTTKVANAEFLFLITKYIINEQADNGFIKIPQEKLLIGLPATQEAAGTGYADEGMIMKVKEYLTK
jgi:chitinase